MKLKQLLVALVLLLTCTQLVQAQTPTDPKALNNMWIDMGLNDQLVDWFNQHAHADDIARADNVRLIDLLDRVHVGRRLVVFKTVDDVETLLPHLTDKIDIVGYNLEHGPSNRPDEIADPVGSVQRMRELTNRYGKTLAFGPDHDFALSDGVAIAPYVDIFVLQVQRVQTEPDTVRDFVLPLAHQLRQANPKLQISVQVRTEGDVAAITALLDSMKDQLDGISILTSPETVDVAQALGGELRLPPSKPLAAVPTIAKPTPTPTPTRTAPGIFHMPVWFCVGGFLIVGLLGGGLVATVFLYNLPRRRMPRRRTLRSWRERFTMSKQHG